MLTGCAGLWRHPSQEPQTLDHWVRLAKFLDEAGFHGIFFADVLGIYDIYNGNGPALTSGAQIPIQDISLFISALAYATKNLCFGITASTTYENPYALARKFSTLDQLSNGRIGWNIVTSYLESAAKSYGHEGLIEHDERYRMAHEFMEVFYKLLEGSWKDGAVLADKKSGVYSDPEKVVKINHSGSVHR
jgi:alkanesulfonate monooxygenase SsuD/methylene tetrahydromethanopterin reductase-like flavin-dependent oxidoreductase (luciferase family)